jgi:CpcD/allophycocyanin linker domain
MATMNVTQSTDLTAYGSRMAILEVSGISTRNGQQTIRVPLNRLSQKMQQIHRQGGTIISVNTGVVMPDVLPSVMAAPPTAPAPVQDAEPELKTEEPKVPQPSNKQSPTNKKKRR